MRTGYLLTKPTPIAVSGIVIDLQDPGSGYEMTVNSPGTGPGVSGGPVVNIRGQVVSVHTGSANDSPFYGIVWSTPYDATAQIIRKWASRR
jgi:S1-C subfamily serine protease